MHQPHSACHSIVGKSETGKTRDYSSENSKVKQFLLGRGNCFQIRNWPNGQAIRRAKFRANARDDLGDCVVELVQEKRRRNSYFPSSVDSIRSNKTMWWQQQITVGPYQRGFHLITDRVLDSMRELKQVSIGIAHVFIQHTSASLTINENADPDVRVDLESSMNAIAPEDFPYVHTMEGPDDMPAHVKCSLLGSSVTVPIRDGRFVLGTWQGIYLCEHRDHATKRRLVITVNGE